MFVQNNVGGIVLFNALGLGSFFATCTVSAPIDAAAVIDTNRNEQVKLCLSWIFHHSSYLAFVPSQIDYSLDAK